MTAGAFRPVRPELSRASWRKTRVHVRRRDRNTCQVCGRVQPAFAKRSFPVGHIVPPERYAGHHDDPANLQTLCWACNSSQSNRTSEEWRAARSGRLVNLGILDGPRTSPYAYGSRRRRVW